MAVISIYKIVISLCLSMQFVHGKTFVKESSELPRDDEEKSAFTLEEFFEGKFSASGWNGTWLTDDTSFLYKDSENDYYKFDVVAKTAEIFLNGSFLDAYPGATISLSPDQTYVLIRYNVSSVLEKPTTGLPYSQTFSDHPRDFFFSCLFVSDVGGWHSYSDFINCCSEVENLTFAAEIFSTFLGLFPVYFFLQNELFYVASMFVVMHYVVFRHSTTAIYAVYDIANNKYYDINNQIAVQLATFDTTGHGFAYVYLNNIYYLSNVLDISSPVEVTNNGVEGIIYNGVPDWVYEEEVLGTGSALWFSPDGKNLAYAKFNDTNVEEFFYFLYGTPGDLDDQYPTLATIKYPKVGTPNPVVQTYLYNIESKITTEFNLIDSIENTEDNNDYVLYDVTWVSNSELAMISTNRIQNESVIIRCTLNGSCAEEVSYKQSNGWLSPAIPKYSEDGTKRLQILPQAFEHDYFNHLVLTDSSANNTKRLTYGNRVVTYIHGWDQANNLVYYVSSLNDTPSQQQIFVVNTETTDEKCLTCNFEVDGELCKYAGASFNSNFTHFIKVCQGPNPAYVLVQSLTNDSDTYLWKDNSVVRESLAKKLRHSQRNLLVPLSSNFTARVRLLLPPNFDETKIYPAVVNVYAGPDSNQINDAFSSGIMNYFVTNRSYIYIYIDGRGSGRDGQNKMFQIYRKMGTVEIEDQIEVTKYLQDNYSFIDRNRTGIWGWSYGGFASTWALVKDTGNVFKFALSVAPVTSFIYYDTIYTERYMGLPTEEDNLLGYNNTDVTRNIEAIRGKLYFIIHGNADDNVHYQQTMLLVKALEAADISFRQQSYPDENHGLGGVSKHLYHTIDKFWARAFGIEQPPLTVWSK